MRADMRLRELSLRQDPDLRQELASLARGCDFVLPSRFKKRLKAFQQVQVQTRKEEPRPPASSEIIPTFYFPRGRPQDTVSVDAVIAKIERVFAQFPHERATMEDMGRVAKRQQWLQRWFPICVVLRSGTSAFVRLDIRVTEDVHSKFCPAFTARLPGGSLCPEHGATEPPVSDHASCSPVAEVPRALTGGPRARRGPVAQGVAQGECPTRVPSPPALYTRRLSCRDSWGLAQLVPGLRVCGDVPPPIVRASKNWVLLFLLFPVNGPDAVVTFVPRCPAPADVLLGRFPCYLCTEQATVDLGVPTAPPWGTVGVQTEEEAGRGPSLQETRICQPGRRRDGESAPGRERSTQCRSRLCASTMSPGIHRGFDCANIPAEGSRGCRVWLGFADVGERLAGLLLGRIASPGTSVPPPSRGPGSRPGSAGVTQRGTWLGLSCSLLWFGASENWLSAPCFRIECVRSLVSVSAWTPPPRSVRCAGKARRCCFTISDPTRIAGPAHHPPAGPGPAQHLPRARLDALRRHRTLQNCHDDAAKFVHLLMSPGCNYLVQEDFVPFLQDVVNTHPGLAFLKEASEFHSRYITTVSTWPGRLPGCSGRVGFGWQNVALLEEEADINQLTEYFSYEHFYVIYCKFWELDTDHDLLIDAQDLARHNDHAISTKMIERIFSGAVTRYVSRPALPAAVARSVSWVPFSHSLPDVTSPPSGTRGTAGQLRGDGARLPVSGRKPAPGRWVCRPGVLALLLSPRRAPHGVCGRRPLVARLPPSSCAPRSLRLPARSGAQGTQASGPQRPPPQHREPSCVCCVQLRQSAGLCHVFQGKSWRVPASCPRKRPGVTSAHVPRPAGKITLHDLKKCKLAHVFFDTFFNIEKYLDHEQKEQVSLLRESESEGPELSDWEKYAAEEYDILVAEEAAGEPWEDGYEAELSPVDQKLGALRSPLAQRPFFEAPSALGTVDLYEYACDDALEPS
ncbi:uncharacterized protein LOC144223936 [Crocuta crocuta]